MMITADFAGVPVGVGLSYDSYRKFFEAQQTEAAPAASVIVGEADRRRAAGFYPAGSTDAYIEYMELCRRVSDVLIPSAARSFTAARFFGADGSCSSARRAAQARRRIMCAGSSFAVMRYRS